MASIMVGYPINMGALMSANTTLVAQQENTSFSYPSTITEYLTNAKVESMPYDTKVKPTGSFDLYKLQDPRNPKSKMSNRPPTTTSQSDEHIIADVGSSDIPSSSAEPSTYVVVTDSEPPSASAPPPTPALRISQILVSLNNWMQIESKLVELSNVVSGQPTTQLDTSEKLTKILDN